jgi:dolichol kinase
MTNEVGRKFVHIIVGSFVAFWPFFLSWYQIRLLSLGFLVVVAASKFFNIFSAIHSVQRPTYGEFFFAMVVGILTFVTHSKSIYAASLLQMSLADGMAAIIGVEYGLRHQHRPYHVLGHAKTLLGTLTFFLISAAILLGYSSEHMQLAWYGALGLAAAATAIENFGVLGLDNLLAPLLVAAVLVQIAG